VGLNRTTIRKVLGERVRAWSSTLPKELRKKVERDTIVTGGAIASMLLGEPVNDYDVYFKTQETTLAVAEHYAKVFTATNKDGRVPVVRLVDRTNLKGITESRVGFFIKSDGVVGEEPESFSSEPEILEEPLVTIPAAADSLRPTKEKYRPLFFSANAVTLSDKFQIILRFSGTPEELHGNYDFVHAMCHYEHCKRRLVLPPEALESLLAKTLVYKGSLYPLASLFRIRKFLKRGWRVGAGELLKISYQIRTVDFEDLAVLEEQLTGVDQSYMNDLVLGLKRAQSEGTKIDELYVVNLIDNVFTNEEF